MNKAAIQRFAIWARTELIAQVSQRAYQYGITKDGYGEANAVTVGGRALSTDEQRQRKELVEQIRRKGYTQVMEEVAYTWFNRFIALRFMEVNNYLPSHIRVFSDSTGAFKPEILNDVLHLDLPGLNADKVAEFIEGNQTEALYRYLLLTQCNALNSSLPRMFERMGGYTEILLPNNILKQDSVLGHMVTDIPEEDWTDQVQIIGWLYQYYNSELKDDTFALLKKNVKITKERIPSATQLFTPDWIVRYMVENSLGRIVISGQCAAIRDEKQRIAKEKELADSFGWKYYLPEAEQTPEVREQLISNHLSLNTDFQISDLKVIDPCMGSGHILVYAFDILVQIYKEYGVSERDAAQSILQNNLYGLDIDDRAAQLAYFAVMMKARQYDRRIFTRGIQPNVYSIVESNKVVSGQWSEISAQSSQLVEYFVNGDTKLEHDLCSILREFCDAKEYGSILNITPVDFAALYARVEEVREDISLFREIVLNDIELLIRIAEIMAQKYDVVVTNPPYMGYSGFTSNLVTFVKSSYPNSKSDMSTMFMEKNLNMCKKTGYVAMINIPVWMFLTSYERLRKELLEKRTIINMVHPGRGIFGSDFGSVSFVISAISVRNYMASYSRLFSEPVEVKTPEVREQQFLNGTGRFFSRQDSFLQIPGCPISYWVSGNVYNAFVKMPALGKIGETKTGMTTGDNDRFLRLWFEISHFDIHGKFEFYSKGSDFRRWFCSVSNVIVWSNNGTQVKNFKGSTIRNEESYFKKCIIWNLITSGTFSARAMYKHQCVMGDASPAAHVKENDYYYILACLNTKPVQQFLNIINPTINCSSGVLSQIPIAQCDFAIKKKVSDISSSCVQISATDWDSFETSWDFARHPLIPKPHPLSTTFGSLSIISKELSAFLREPKAETAADFIQSYFRSRAKEELFNLEAMNCDQSGISSRAAHTVTTFLLGHYISDQFNTVFPHMFKVTANQSWSFEYLWFLCCLYHDTFSTYEYRTQAIPDSPRDIAKSGASGDCVYTIYDEHILDVELPKPTYDETSVVNYYHFRKDSYCLDHGIAAGYTAFQKLVDNYMEARGSNGLQDKFMTTLSGRWAGHVLVWDKKQIAAHACAADAIISHNIWWASKLEDIERYQASHLDRFIVNNLNKRLSISENPLSYLLSLVDTIEPIKYFSVKQGKTEKEILDNLSIQCIDAQIVISQSKQQVLDLEKWYKDKHFCRMRDWLDGISSQYDESGMITINLPCEASSRARIADKYADWEAECNDRFNQLKANEEELNRIFIDIYGLQDELTPEVEDKDVTVRKADLGRDIRSLISYAVGCMFGRYSLDVEGLVYAGGKFSGQWVVVGGQRIHRREIEYYVGKELSRAFGMAEIHAVDRRNIQIDEADAERGIVFTYGSNEAGGSFDSLQYSRGTSKKLYEGICELPIDCKGFQSRIGDAAYDLCSPEILDAITNGNGNGLVRRGWKNADSIDWQTVHCTLTTNHYHIDEDNVIPICDDDYFEDDITGRFVKWVEAVYGKDTLEENLKFIADALGGKGTPREVIRNYFINDFYADHLKIYQKRPIYWLFDSGKKNGFKALIYMHRYQSDLLAKMRTDYVHEQQERYRTQLSHLADAIDHASASERVKLTKQQKKIQEQALEIQKYEEKVHHLADMNISIDLDDGVKVNYSKFEDVLAKIK